MENNEKMIRERERERERERGSDPEKAQNSTGFVFVLGREKSIYKDIERERDRYKVNIFRERK